MGFITAAIVGGLVLGAGAAVSASKNAKKQRRQAQAIAKQQETEARNLAAQGDVLDDTGADIEIGTEGTGPGSGARRSGTGRTRKAQTSGTAIGRGSAGGVGGLLRNRGGIL